MMIADRNLIYRSEEGDIRVAVRIHAPVPTGSSTGCRFEIEYPDRTYTHTVYGEDGIQALVLAFAAIQVHLYGSSYHIEGKLHWNRPGSGYGFPPLRQFRHELIGEDLDEFGP
jgi:hypothetical protein